MTTVYIRCYKNIAATRYTTVITSLEVSLISIDGNPDKRQLVYM